jgi:hypothetical protein
VNEHLARLGRLLLHIVDVTSIARATARRNADVIFVVGVAPLQDVGDVEGNR